MSRMDAGIILAGQQPNIPNALASGARAAGFTNEIARANALNALYRQQGPGIAQGQPEALNALAGLDPMAAYNVRQAEREGARADERLGLARSANAREDERLAMARAEGERQAYEAARDETRRAQAEREVAMVADLLPLWKEGQATGDWRAFTTRAQGYGVETSPEAFPVTVAAATGMVEKFNEMVKTPEPKGPQSAPGKIQADINAGILPEGTPLRGPGVLGDGITMRTADGTEVIVGKGGKIDEKVNVSSPGAVMDTIDAMLNDPALDWSTGALAWTQILPGTPMFRFGTRMQQLSGQQFLQAIESLRGLGQMTELEGQEAKSAQSRVQSALHPNDMRDALLEYRSILARANARPRGWIEKNVDAIASMSMGELSELDVTKLTIEQLEAMERRAQALQAEAEAKGARK